MNKFLASSVLLASFAIAACTPFGGGLATGAAVGALGTGAAYEYSNKRQMDRLEEDFRSGRIDRREYQSRKAQIEKGSVIY